ncbi:Uma2 family endonuclease [Streptomyces sp. NPDC048197]|uniref:Uma2 family endonuclease n=1 Tax=Streptomyces sp. NPDC048197 TaxID=3365511 RepID=UPI00371A43AF
MWRATEMTAVDDHRMTQIFQNLEVPEGVKVELLRGNIVMMATPDLVHNEIVESVQDQIPRQAWMRLQTQDITIPGEASEPVPDLVVLPRDARPESGPPPSGVIATVIEVVSKTSVDHDYGIKRSIYAAGKVPAYLIIDPIVAHCVLLTQPVGVGDEADYRTQQITKFGEPLPLPLLGLELDTSEFGTLKGVRPHRRP